MLTVHFLLCISLIISAISAAFKKNPIHSVLSLILTFCISGVILFLFHLDFFGLILIIIYVGAIAVIFLFVIMMLNIKKELQPSYKFVFKRFVVSFAYLIFLILVLCYFFNFTDIKKFILELIISPSKNFLDINEGLIINNFDTLLPIEVLGQVLFNYYNIYVFLAGIILLIALVGSITLTLDTSKRYKIQISSKQLSRTTKFVRHIS